LENSALLTFLALLSGALLAVDFLAERALRTSYETDAYRELQFPSVRLILLRFIRFL